MRASIPVMLILVCAGAAACGAELEVQGLQRRLWGGRAVRPVVRADGVEPEVVLRLVWALTFGDRVIEGEVRGLKAPFEQEVPLDLPDVRARTDVAFQVHLFAGAEQIAEQRRELELFPAGRLRALAAAFEEREIGLVAVGEGARELAGRLPLECKELDSALAVAQFEGDFVILVATQRLSPLSELASSLLGRVEDGLNVVCLGGAAPALPLDELGPARPGAVKATRVLAPAHLAVSDLAPGDLSDWGRDGVVARGRLGWPERGDSLTVVDPGPEGEPGALVVELRRGRGRILLCALAALEKLREEPVAELVVANLLRWGLREPAPMARCFACMGGPPGLAEAMSDLGVEFATGRPGPQDVLIADGSLMDKQHAALLARKLREGGTIVLFHLSEDGIAGLNRALRARWQADVSTQPPEVGLAPADPATLRGFELEGAHRLLAGVRPEDVRALAAELDWEGVPAVRAAADTEHFVDLAGAGILAKFERDGLRIIFWQVPLADGDATGAQRRLLLALLTNLNVPLSAEHQP